MNRFIPQYFDLLKRELLDRCGITRINPSDCKFISEEVFGKTKHYISETTLKRLFGFAYSTFNPSSFTLNALSDYCGYQGWDDFCEKTHAASSTPDGDIDKWHKIVANAERITHNTLQILKARSGIPYDKTIPRIFLDTHMRVFLESGNTATVLAAPADFGKTIALCHWVDAMLEENIKTGKNDVILFFSHNALQNPSVHSYNMNDWIRALLGIYGDEQFPDISANRPEGSRVILIIDGIDEYKHRNDTYDVITQIIDVVTLYQQHKWLRIVVSLRSYVWTNNRHKISSVSQDWFSGFATSRAGDANVPLLTYEEILAIANGLSFEKQELNDVDLLEYFRFPLCLQYLYRLNPEKFTLNRVSEFDIFETISAYFLHKIFRSKHGQDAMQLLVHLVGEVDLTADEWIVPRLKMTAWLKEYHAAYLELLNNGFLHEYNVSEMSGYRAYVKIAYGSAVKRLYARKIINDSNGSDTLLMGDFNRIPRASALRSDILKWIIYLKVTGEQGFDLRLLEDTEITINERSQLLTFYVDLIRKYSSAHTDKDSHYLIDENASTLLGLEYINKTYEKSLEHLLTLDDYQKYHVTIRICLGVIAILHLDLEKLTNQIKALRKLTEEPFLEYPINPLYCLETAYTYLKFGTVKTEGLKMLTRFYFNPRLPSAEVPVRFREILYLLGLYTLLISNNSKKSMRFLNALAEVYPSGTPGYNFIRETIHAEALVGINQIDKARKVLEGLSVTYQASPESMSSFMRASYYATRLLIEPFRAEQAEAFMQMCDQSGYNFLKSRVIADILSKSELSAEQRQFYQIELMRTVTRTGCWMGAFIQS